MTGEIDASQWAEFLGTAKSKPWGPRRGEGEVNVKPKSEIEVSREYKAQYLPGESYRQQRPFWGWSLGYGDPGPRTCWLCHGLIPLGCTGVYVSSSARQVHVACLRPDQWDTILGQPYGGDATIMGSLRAKYTRDAKKDLA